MTQTTPTQAAFVELIVQRLESLKVELCNSIEKLVNSFRTHPAQRAILVSTWVDKEQRQRVRRSALGGLDRQEV